MLAANWCFRPEAVQYFLNSHFWTCSGVGFKDPHNSIATSSNSTNYRDYPLQKLWGMGLALTICTNNLEISKTTLTNEYFTASRLVEGIYLWDILAMIKQAFSHSFCRLRK